MTFKKFGAELLKMIINTILSLGLLLLIFGMEIVNKKADIDYVDKQDEAIKTTIESDKATHQIQHSVEYEAVLGQLDIVVKWVESKE